ncbi:hypothetical protein [Demequina sp. NBRC 110056]|uniref:hypothetical protein n=1 Tax=Demequina sp. NBRC 110056 TaxID=1570345 RepID=UPI0013564E72|nr:hypothetical protein [Demequina sp. NBRC 110056]
MTDDDKPDLAEIAEDFQLPAIASEDDEADEPRSAVDRVSRLPMSHTFPPAMDGNGPGF